MFARISRLFKMKSKITIPYGRHSISSEDLNAVLSVLSSDYLTQGPVVEQFENELRKKVKSSYAISMNSATSALHVACMALNLGPGDSVWTTPTTFVASANCARYCGADVDFVDIDEETGLMSVEYLENKLEAAYQSNRLPSVIIPVHLGGSSCDMKKISDLANRYNIKIVEDASHAIGAYYCDEPVGNCRYSNITVFSFHPVKIITTAEGGVATTNDQKLASRMRELRSHGITKDIAFFENKPAGPWSYEQQSLGYNYRLTDLQAALGISQMNRLDALVKKRHQIYENYQKKLHKLELKLLRIPDDVFSSLHLAVIRLNNKSSEYHRTVFEGLRAAGIGVQLHYSPVHLQPYYRRLGFREGYCPKAEEYGHNAISLPIYPGLLETEQERVVDVLKCLLDR
jgi:UDP-4-amino-4,6-dideoxy-N-acetyl-beta-L-altrosamine transaminase